MRIETDEARAGKTGVGLRYVLAVSWPLPVVVMIIAYLGVI